MSLKTQLYMRVWEHYCTFYSQNSSSNKFNVLIEGELINSLKEISSHFASIFHSWSAYLKCIFHEMKWGPDMNARENLKKNSLLLKNKRFANSIFRTAFFAGGMFMPLQSTKMFFFSFCIMRGLKKARGERSDEKTPMRYMHFDRLAEVFHKDLWW